MVFHRNHSSEVLVRGLKTYVNEGMRINYIPGLSCSKHR